MSYPTITNPYQVTSPNGRVNLFVMNHAGHIPVAFALMGTQAADKVAIRISGGCKEMNAQDKTNMLDYFSAALQGFQGLIWSGGTRTIGKDGQVDPMITEVPGVIANANPGCVALGSVPRTGTLSLQGDSRLVLDQYNVPNPSMSGILIVQNGSDGSASSIGSNGGWDLDVPTAYELMNQWRDSAGFRSLAAIGWNGGPITADEIVRAANNGYTTVVVAGSGRAADDIAKAISGTDHTFGGRIKAGSVQIAQRSDPQTLRTILQKAGFIRHTSRQASGD